MYRRSGAYELIWLRTDSRRRSRWAARHAREGRLTGPLAERRVFALAKAAWVLCGRVEEELPESLGTDLQQFAVLVILGEWGGTSQGKVGEHLGMDPASAGRLMERMEGLGLLERSRDEFDKRKLACRLTDEGMAVLGECEVIRKRVEAEFGPDQPNVKA